MLMFSIKNMFIGEWLQQEGVGGVVKVGFGKN